MEKIPDSNPWVEKLEQVSLPDAGEAWKTMAAVLDKEMPVVRRRRRLLLLILLPFLLGGAGYFVWRQAASSRTSQVPGRRELRTEVSGAAAGNGVAGNRRGVAGSGVAGSGVAGSTSTAAGKGGHAGGNRGTAVDSMGRAVRDIAAAGGAGSLSAAQLSGAPSGGSPGGASSGGLHLSGAPSGGMPPDGLPSGLVQPGRAQVGNIVPLDVAGPHLIRGPLLRSNDPLKCPPVEAQKMTRWVAGVGLNQSIPVDGQQVWTNPSGGLNTWWKDYIPVPFVRYYFQPKIFAQVEVRIHAPQYTPRNLWFYYQYNDTFYSGSVIIKKLFYFQLPVSIHYAPDPNWSVGLGLQYSHYGKGIAAIADSSFYNYFYIGPLSGFPMVFVQHNEFRGLVSLDYTYRHWIIGMSYDEAFNKAISIRVPDPIATPQAHVLYSSPPVRNSSLQLSVRYILWDGRSRGR